MVSGGWIPSLNTLPTLLPRSQTRELADARTNSHCLVEGEVGGSVVSGRYLQSPATTTLSTSIPPTDSQETRERAGCRMVNRVRESGLGGD